MGDTNIVNKFFLWMAIGSTFFLFGISTIVWETIPFFKYIQYPSRWLNMIAFAVVLLSAAIFWAIVTLYKTKKSQVLFIALLFLACIFLDSRYIISSCIFKKGDFETHQASNWTYEHLPIWVDIERISENISQEKIRILRGEGRVETVSWRSAERIVEIEAYQPLTVRIRTFNFPGWKAYVDGKETKIRTEEGAGAMLIDLPRGRHTLVLKFVDTPVRHYSKIISLVSFLGISLVLLFSGKRPV